MKKYNINDLLRSQYDVLHTLAMSESVERGRIMKLILYHGTDCSFDKIDLKMSRNYRDFGIGFYTTTIASQAALNLLQ